MMGQQQGFVGHQCGSQGMVASLPGRAFHAGLYRNGDEKHLARNPDSDGLTLRLLSPLIGVGMQAVMHVHGTQPITQRWSDL